MCINTETARIAPSRFAFVSTLLFSQRPRESYLSRPPRRSARSAPRSALRSRPPSPLGAAAGPLFLVLYQGSEPHRVQYPEPKDSPLDQAAKWIQD